MDIDIELLITEVQKRRPLYDIHSAAYHDRNKKKQLWEEICKILFAGWSSYTLHEKTKYGKEIQRRWNSLRDCFRRELHYQKSLPSGSGGANARRKYKFYDSLVFLLPYTQIMNTESAFYLRDKSPVSDAGDTAVEKPAKKRMKRNVAADDTDQELKNNSNSNTGKDNIIMETCTIDNAKNDDDESFLMSLKPFVKDFTGDQKLIFRIEMMKFILNFKQRIGHIDEPTHSQRRRRRGRPSSSSSSVVPGDGDGGTNAWSGDEVQIQKRPSTPIEVKPDLNVLNHFMFENA